jgi:hypothetical protein
MFEANHLGAGPKHSTQPSKLTIGVVHETEGANHPRARCRALVPARYLARAADKRSVEVVDADRKVSKLAKLAADLPTARCCSSPR